MRHKDEAREHPWLIRVATRPEDGAGHVSRCRALGKALLRAAPVVMAVDKEGTDWIPLLKSDGFQVVVGMDLWHGPWAGSVLDCYHEQEEQARWMASHASPLIYFDDYLTPPKKADLIVNAAPGLEGTQVNNTPALLGSQYALLSEDFHIVSHPHVKMNVEHVLVTFGMGDPFNGTGKALNALSLLRCQEFHPRITVVMGSFSPLLREVESSLRQFDQAELRTDVKNMAALLRTADLVVGAGGVSLLERMACGIPSLTLCAADNQRLFVEGAVRLGATRDGGSLESRSCVELADAIMKLVSDRQQREDMAAVSSRLVDGRGAGRVADAIQAFARGRVQQAGHR